MSCDFMVFEPDAAPRERKAFMAWYFKTTDWDMEADFDNPALTSTRLQEWYTQMIKVYRPLNGPFAPPDDEIDDPRLTDYTITPTVIYAGFRWSEAESAMEACKRLAFQHGLGFYDPQREDAGIFFPDSGAALPPSPSWWSRLFR